MGNQPSYSTWLPTILLPAIFPCSTAFGRIGFKPLHPVKKSLASATSPAAKTLGIFVLISVSTNIPSFILIHLPSKKDTRGFTPVAVRRRSASRVSPLFIRTSTPLFLQVTSETE